MVSLGHIKGNKAGAAGKVKHPGRLFVIHELINNTQQR